MTEEVRIASMLERVATICGQLERRLEQHETRFDDHETRLRGVEDIRSKLGGGYMVVVLVVSLVGPTVVFALDRILK